jgi:hypothetical protein
MKREKKGMSRDSWRNRKLFSFSLVFMFILTSFTVMIIVVPDQAKAATADPYTLTVYTTKDSYTSEVIGQRDTNHGTSDDLYVDSLITQRNRVYVYMSTSSIPSDAKILDAKLYLRCRATQGGSRTLRAHRITQSWGETTITWNNDPSYSSTDYASKSFSGTGWQYWDVDSMVQAFVDGTSNYGWCIKDASENTPLLDGTMYRRFYSEDYGSTSYDPYLYVEYCRPPITQTNAATSVTSTSAILNGEVSNDRGENCDYAFVYSLTSGSYGLPGYTLASLVTNDPFSRPVSSLDEGRRYYFKSILKNAAGAGDYGSELSFLTAPAVMTDFTATAFGVAQMNLSWTNGAGGDGAYIEYTDTDPGAKSWNPGGKTKIDADGYVAGTSYSHTGLDVNRSYYYKAWPYASDGGWTSDGTDIKPYGTATSIVDDQTEDFPGQWFVVDGSNLHSCCAGESPDLEAALDGTNVWTHSVTETHWFIIDLGTNYTVGKVRGRSITADDPTSVNIHVSRNLSFSENGAQVASDISKWQDTINWATVDSTDRDGRYIKVEITSTEDDNNHIQWGYMADPFTIFDAYVSNCLPEMSCKVNNSTPDMGSPITFDASESFDQGGSIVNYKWDFDGDGQTDSETETAAVDHEYNFSSVYTAIITAEDDLGSTNSTTQQVTVKQKITVVNNSENNGINYITWGATASIQADELAGESYADLQTGDTILMFNATSGDWDISYTYPEGSDFTINRWDHIRIHCTNSKTFSVTPDVSVDSSQNKTLTYSVDNHGYHYYTWSNDFSITASDFATNSKLDLTNQPISVYNPTTGKWKGYTEIPGLPQVIKDGMDFYISPYDVICFKVASGTENAYYDASNYEPT